MSLGGKPFEFQEKQVGGQQSNTDACVTKLPTRKNSGESESNSSEKIKTEESNSCETLIGWNDLATQESNNGKSKEELGGATCEGSQKSSNLPGTSEAHAHGIFEEVESGQLSPNVSSTTQGTVLTVEEALESVRPALTEWINAAANRAWADGTYEVSARHVWAAVESYMANKRADQTED